MSIYISLDMFLKYEHITVTLQCTWTSNNTYDVIQYKYA